MGLQRLPCAKGEPAEESGRLNAWVQGARAWSRASQSLSTTCSLEWPGAPAF